MTPSILQAKVSKSATFDGTGLDISAMLSNSVVRIKINSLTAGKVVVFALEDSVDAFSGSRVVATWSVKGEVVAVAPREKDFHNWEVPELRWNTTSAVLRLSILSIDSGTTVSYEGYVQPGA